MEEYAVAVARTHAQRERIVATRDKRVHKHFKRAPALPASAAQKKGPRWLPDRDASNAAKITQWMLKWVPKGGGIDVDDYNGRWRALYPPTNSWKSASWTQRGYEKAACEAIWWTRSFHSDFTKEVPPFDLGELEKRFRDADLA